VTHSQLKTQIILGAAAAGAGAASMIWLATGVAATSPDLSGKTFAQAQASLKLAPERSRAYSASSTATGSPVSSERTPAAHTAAAA
jgi:hypothetical protein